MISEFLKWNEKERFSEVSLLVAAGDVARTSSYLYLIITFFILS